MVNSYRIDEDLELRSFDPKFAEELFSLTDSNRAYLREWLPWVDNTKVVDTTRSFLKSTVEAGAKNNTYNFIIFYKNQIAGCVAQHAVDKENKFTSIGYWLAENFCGNGIMTKACKKLIELSFSTQGVETIEIRAAVENKKSRAIPERLGFKLDGILRQKEWLYDHFVDHACYSLLKSEYNK